MSLKLVIEICNNNEFYNLISTQTLDVEYTQYHGKKEINN